MFCMSLMKDENRKAFKATRPDISSVSTSRRAGGGHPQARLQPDAGARRQHLFHRQARRDRRAFVPASRRGDDRLDATGLCRDDARRAAARSKATARGPARPRPAQLVAETKAKAKAAAKTRQDQSEAVPKRKQSPNRNRHRKPNPQPNGSDIVAKIIAGIGSSHVPAIGAALDNNKTEEPYWKRVFSGFEKSQEWMRELKPDVAIVVYNDHASAFSVDLIPTFALGCAAEFPPADEGWGPRPVPVVQGRSGACRAHRAVGHPRRVRPHHRQQDGGRPRAHRAAQSAVRQAFARPGSGRSRSSRSRSTS